MPPLVRVFEESGAEGNTYNLADSLLSATRRAGIRAATVMDIKSTGKLEDSFVRGTSTFKNIS